MRAIAPRVQLAAVTHHWGGYYTRVAQSVLRGTWKPQAVWGGMKDGWVQLSALDPSLPADVLAGLEQRRVAIVTGRMQPFEGRIVDQQGRVRQDAGRMSDERIATMDWFVQGVVGTPPRT
jgi:simple sugar transport system substrate-binding protein